MNKLSVIVLTALASCLAAACAAGSSPNAAPNTANIPSTNPMIARVETGLRAVLQVAGEPVETWRLADRMAFYKVPGVSIAVIKDGKIAWAKGYGALEAGKPQPVDAQTLFQAGSISKPTTALAALRLVEQGRLSLDAPFNETLKSWKIPDNEFTRQTAVTLRQILSHGAGFNTRAFQGYAAGTPLPTTLQILDGLPPANTTAVRVAQRPGSSWRYSGGGYIVLQQALMDVWGKDFPTLMDELVLRPAGMARSTFQNPLPQRQLSNAAAGHKSDGSALPGGSNAYPEMAAAGLWTTPSDLSRMALSVVASAKAEKGALLNPETTRQLLTKQIGEYGLGFSLRDMGDGLVFTHSGSDVGFEAFLFSYADGRGGLAIMTNGQQGARLSGEIMTSVAAAYGWKYGGSNERVALKLTPEQAAAFVGSYVIKTPNQPDVPLAITADGDKLWIDAPPRLARQRFYVASDTQVFTATTLMLPLKRDQAGKALSIEIAPGVVAERNL